MFRFRWAYVDLRLDLRGGRTLWEAVGAGDTFHRRLAENLAADILIIGSGISGSFLAERLSRLEYSIIVLDRNKPQMASTAASTALLLWAIDTPLQNLARRIGFNKAAEIYQVNVEAVRGIADLVQELDISCHCIPRPSLYLAGRDMGFDELAKEQKIRERAGIPSSLISGKVLGEKFGFYREGALYERACAEIDPVALARGLMHAAIKRGVRVFTPVSAVEYDLTSRAASVLTDGGYEIEAKWLILANGYEMPPFVPASIHSVVSTWVFATAPNATSPWRDNALVWEASNPYLYMRHTADGRIIVGGEDEKLLDPNRRDRLISAKCRKLLGKLRELSPSVVLGPPDFAWAGFFGTTEDGLPLIGQLPGYANVHAAFGYGGNGITYSAIAANLIADSIAGRRNSLLESFAVDRESG